MRRSLRRRLGWAHTALFAAAIAVAFFLAWRELRLEQAGEHVQASLLRAAAEACVPFALVGTVSWFLIYRALAPVEKLTEAAETIHEGSLHRRIPVRGTGDELDRLTSVLNDMTGRLDASFQRVREFSLHASHELKTPLTILRSGFEQTLSRPNLDPQISEQVMNWADEVDRLNRIVNGLTLLTRADARKVALQREAVALHDLVRDAAAEAEILGASRELHITQDITEPVRITGDRHRLRQVLLNLTDNAVKYNRPGGSIHFSLTVSGPAALIRVTNEGPGISSADLPLIFDRFFRGAASRAGESEGIGLGLSIAHWIAREHGGSLEAASTPESTTFTFRLPRVPAPSET